MASRGARAHGHGQSRSSTRAAMAGRRARRRLVDEACWGSAWSRRLHSPSHTSTHGLGARACEEEEDGGDEERREGGGDQQLPPAASQAHHPRPHHHAHQFPCSRSVPINPNLSPLPRFLLSIERSICGLLTQSNLK
jgi:hypothetical protein